MSQALVPIERIENKIYLIRGIKVMLDFDLAELYEVEVKVLKRSVRRNPERFPSDFMFVLNREEQDSLRSQIGTLKKRGKHPKYLSYVFSEQGIAMLSSVLNSERAIQVNIQIIRTFSKLREMIAENSQLRRQLENLERRYDEQFKVVFDAIRRLLTEDEKPRTEIGYRINRK